MLGVGHDCSKTLLAYLVVVPRLQFPVFSINMDPSKRLRLPDEGKLHSIARLTSGSIEADPSPQANSSPKAWRPPEFQQLDAPHAQQPFGVQRSHAAVGAIVGRRASKASSQQPGEVQGTAGRRAPKASSQVGVIAQRAHIHSWHSAHCVCPPCQQLGTLCKHTPGHYKHEA